MVKERIMELVYVQRTGMAATKDHIKTVNEAMNAQSKEIEEKEAGLSRIESRAGSSRVNPFGSGLLVNNTKEPIFNG